MKKMNKVLVGVAVLLIASLIPLSSLSKEQSGVLVLAKTNTLVLDSEVNGDSTSSVIAKAKQMTCGKDHPLYLFLNTPGGSVKSGLEMIESLKGLGCPIHTITLFAASMGFQIVQNLDYRYILRAGTLMSHRAAGQFEGSFGGQAPSQIDNRYHLWLQRMNEMDEQTVKRTNGKQTLESYQKAYSSELWMTGQESVADGYADKVVNVKCDSSLSGTTTHSLQFMGLEVSYEIDNCPINTSPLNVKVAVPAGIVSQEYTETVKRQFINHYRSKENKVVDSF